MGQPFSYHPDHRDPKEIKMQAVSLRTRRSIGALCACTLLFAGTAHAGYPSDKVAMYSHLSLGDLGVNFAEDCWGYVSESGREYAIVGVSSGTAFVEITDPTNPVIVDIMTQSNRGRDMKVYQNYVYSSSDSGPTHVYDVSDIDNGVITHVRSFNRGTHNLALDEVSGFLYLAVGGPMRVYDLSDPSNPNEVGIWEGETHDAQIVTYTDGPYAGRQIAFVFAGRSDRLDIVDVTDKSNIFRIGQTGYPSAAYTHQGWLTADRRYLYVSDELDDIARTTIIDVSDLTNPTFIRDFTTGSSATDHNLFVHNGFIFEANYSSGMHIFNTVDPENPVRVGYFDTFPANDNPSYDGAWATYPFFPSGTVIVSDRDGGLFVLDVREAVGAGDCTRDPGWRCDGDVDGDGQVNPVDSGLVQSAFGSADGQDLCNYDVDCDGQITPVDSGLVQALFGTCNLPRYVCP